MIRHGAVALLVACSLGLCAPVSHAEEFPSRPIKVVIGFAAGGVVDILLRAITARLGAAGWTVIVENRPSAGTIVAADAVAKSAPDGYTLLFVSSTSITPSPSLYAKLPFDLVKSFEPVAGVGSAAYVLEVNPSLAAKSLKELAVIAKNSSSRLDYGSAGVGSGTNLCMELFNEEAGTKIQHIPYKGGALWRQSLLTGEVQVACGGLSAADVQQIKRGSLRAIAVTGPKREKSLPDVPTVVEQGFPGMQMTTSFGFLAPAGTPADVIATLNAKLSQVVNKDDLRAFFDIQGVTAVAMTSADFGVLMKTEIDKWAGVIRAANIHVQ